MLTSGRIGQRESPIEAMRMNRQVGRRAGANNYSFYPRDAASARLVVMGMHNSNDGTYLIQACKNADSDMVCRVLCFGEKRSLNCRDTP
jgi:hypothetical protein